MFKISGKKISSDFYDFFGEIIVVGKLKSFWIKYRRFFCSLFFLFPIPIIMFFIDKYRMAYRL